MTPLNNSQLEQPAPEITLRCNRCGKPITPAEAVQTPTGYRCRECVRQQQKIYDTSKPLDYVWGAIIAVALSLGASFLAGFLGFFTVLLAPAAGAAIAEVVRAATRKRRSVLLFRLVGAGVIVGALPLIIIQILNLILLPRTGAIGFRTILPLAYQIAYLVLAVPSAYYRLSGRRRL